MKHKQVSEHPKRYCETCKREVYQTVHWINEDPEDKGFYVDWCGINNIVYCITCHRDLTEKRKK